MDANESKTAGKTGMKRSNKRQWILIGLLALVAAAFLLDRYVLLPSAQKKIEKVVNEVTMSLNDKNRKQVEEIVGQEPTTTYKHGNMEVVQYRFARGLPFYPRPILDIAYEGDAIVFAKPIELTPEILEGLKPKITVSELDKENRDESVIMSAGSLGDNRGSLDE